MPRRGNTPRGERPLDAPAPTPDDLEPIEPAEDEDDGSEPETVAAKPKESAPAQIARLRREIADHGREWKRISRGSGSPPPRAHQLAELMDAKQEMIMELEPTVEIQVDRPARGRSYVVGEREFLPGRHRVKSSVAEVLRWLMDQNRIGEARRMHNLQEQRQMDPYGLEGIIDPATQTDRAVGTVQA